MSPCRAPRPRSYGRARSGYGPGERRAHAAACRQDAKRGPPAHLTQVVLSHPRRRQPAPQGTIEAQRVLRLQAAAAAALGGHGDQHGFDAAPQVAAVDVEHANRGETFSRSCWRARGYRDRPFREGHRAWTPPRDGVSAVAGAARSDR